MLLAHRLVLAQMYWNDHMDRDRVTWWMPIVWLACLALVVVVAVVLLRGTAWSRPSTPTPPSGQARTILTERYARGELTTKELRERMAALDELEHGTP
jgi:putative membrane protein